MPGGWELVFYVTRTGRCPVKDFVDGLSGGEAARVSWALDLLEQMGIVLGAPHVRHMGDKLWELRVVGGLQHRVFYFATSERRLILVHAFTKKSSRTARAEIEIAKRRMTDHLRRSER